MKTLIFNKCNHVIFPAIIVFLFIPIQLGSSPSFVGNVIGGSIPSNFPDYWNQVTSENASKWGSVESSRDSMNWGSIDSHYDYAKGRGYPYKFHTLVWGSQEPGWISGLSQNEQLEEVTEWIQAVGQRYSPDMIDVVNEPLHAKPSYRNALGGDGSSGWDWVIKAFELAKQYCSGKRLINEYGIINDGNALNQYLEIINLLKSKGLIDGIGIQCHCFNVDTLAASSIRSNLDKLAQTGLPIYVSELDIRGDDATQKARYEEKFPEFYTHSSVKGITLWGYIQGEIWQSEAWLAGSGSSGATERPAMQWLMEYTGRQSGNSTPEPTPMPPTSPPSSTNPPTSPPSSTNPPASTNPPSGDCGALGCGTCNWYGTVYPLCCTTTSGWGWENNMSCIALSTCSGSGRSASPCGGDSSPTSAPTSPPSSTNPPTSPPSSTTDATQTPTSPPSGSGGSACSPSTSISIPFTKDGTGEYCWAISSLNYINSWNCNLVEVNGVDFTNKYACSSNLPAQIDGKWYITYKGNYGWSHFEAK